MMDNAVVHRARVLYAQLDDLLTGVDLLVKAEKFYSIPKTPLFIALYILSTLCLFFHVYPTLPTLCLYGYYIYSSLPLLLESPSKSSVKGEDVRKRERSVLVFWMLVGVLSTLADMWEEYLPFRYALKAWAIVLLWSCSESIFLPVLDQLAVTLGVDSVISDAGKKKQA